MPTPLAHLKNLGVGQDMAITQGHLVCTTITAQTPEQAVAMFLKAGGTGWLCTTHQSEISQFSPSCPLTVPANAWPLCGESVDGLISCHLQQVGADWQITTVEEHPSSDPSSILLTRKLQARNGGFLCYQAAWKAETTYGLTEIRPYAYRFTGFDSHS